MDVLYVIIIMQDKVVIITGANDGIGLYTAQRLAEKGAQIILTCRDERKGYNAATLIAKQTGNHKSLVIPLDLGDMNSVSTAAEFILTEHPTIDVLVNNAGVFTNDLKLTTDGYELQFGVNHLGHFLLTNLLLPALRCTRQGGRVVTVSSAAHYHGEIDFENLKGEKGSRAYNGMKAYAQSKLANVLFTKELAKRFPNDLMANCLHPGVVGTDFANKGANTITKLIWNLYRPFARKPYRGADTSVYLASSPEVRDVSGRFFDQNQCVKKPAELAQNETVARNLWEYSEKACANFLPN